VRVPRTASAAARETAATKRIEDKGSIGSYWPDLAARGRASDFQIAAARGTLPRRSSLEI